MEDSLVELDEMNDEISEKSIEEILDNIVK